MRLNILGITDILTSVKNGQMTVEDAESKIKYLPFEDIKYAMVDYHRELRTGYPEVIYCQGKTSEQVQGIVANMKKNDMQNILLTRVKGDMFERVERIYSEAKYHQECRLITIEKEPFKKNKGEILVITAGTSDIAVSEEAAITAEFLGNNVTRLNDVGVAGLHRILSKLDLIKNSNVIIVVAGMEGALASVVGGLTDKPIIAVPTSVGYGANLQGFSALVSMLNSCASGVGVVNIDNGFGAAYLANSINKLSN